MSSYICKTCGSPGFLNDSYIGLIYVDVVCLECFKKLDKADEDALGASWLDQRLRWEKYMADTTRLYEDKPCDDCGKSPILFHHWGPLVPSGTTGNLCGQCMHERSVHFNKHGTAKPWKEPA